MTNIKFIGTGGVWSGSPGNANVEMDMDDVLFFDGSDDKIDTNLNLNSTNSTGNSTFMCWIQAHPDKAAADQNFLSGYKGSDGGRWDFIHRDDNTVRFQHHDKGDGAQYLLDTGVVNKGYWHHVAVVHDTTANTTTLYWNGESITSQGSVTNDLTPDEDLHIGCQATSGSHFHGYIADVYVYDAALTQEQVARAASKVGATSNFIAAGTPDGYYSLINNATSNQGGGGGSPSVTGTARTHGLFDLEVIPTSAELADIGTNTNDGSFTASVTDVTLTVGDGTKFHVGQIIKIDNELLYVSGISSNDLTVRRGICNTTIAAHNTGTDIYNASAYYINGNLNLSSGKYEALTASCVDLDGSADYIRFATHPQTQMRSSHTWSAWIRMDDGQGDTNMILGAKDGSGDDSLTKLFVDTNGKLNYQYDAEGSSKTATSDSAVFVNNANPWAHVVATMSYTDSSNAVMKLYFNGEELDLDGTNNGAFSGNMGTYTADNDDYLVIGANNVDTTIEHYFDGKIRDVRLYESALTEAQVSALYGGKLPNKALHRWTIGASTEDIFSHGMTTTMLCVPDSGYGVTAALGSDLAANKDLVSAYSTAATKIGGPSIFLMNDSSWSGYNNETGFTTTRGEVYFNTVDFDNFDGSHSSGPKIGIMTGAVGSSRGTTQNIDTSSDGLKRSFHLLTHATQGTSFTTMESQGTYRSRFENVSCKRVSVGSTLVGLGVQAIDEADLTYQHLEYANGFWIGTNATVSATNGTMEIYQYDVSGNFTIKNTGTFTPNWGTVVLGLPNNQSYGEEQYFGNQGDGDDAIEFYNLSTNQGWNRFYFQSTTVRNVFNLSGYRNWLIGTSANETAGNHTTLTMGYTKARFTGTSDTGPGLDTGGYITGSGGFSVGGSSANAVTIQGASKLFQCPVHNTNTNLNNHLFMQNSDINGSYQPQYAANAVEFGNLSFQHDWTSVTEAKAGDISCDTNSNTTVTCSGTTTIKVGQTVTGSGIPRNTTVTAVNASTVTSFTISQAATATATATLSFHDIAFYKIIDDCSFKSITMQQGAHLDLNGKRIYVDGDFTISSSGRGSSFDADGEVYLTGSHAIGSLAHELMNNLSSNTVVHQNSSSKNQNTSLGGSGALARVVVAGSSTIRHSGDRDFNTTPLEVLSGTYDPDADATWGSIRGATSSTIDLDADTLTLKGDLTLSGGVIGTSAVDGTAATIPHNTNSTKYGFSGDKSFEGWFKIDNGSAPSVVSYIDLIAKNNFGYGISMLSDGRLIAGTIAGDQRWARGRTAINDGRWHHVAWTHDVSEADGIKIYVDGRLDGQSELNNPAGSDSGGNVNLVIGGATYIHYDEIRIYNDIRTEDEIRDNMWGHIATDTAGLLGYYKCEDINTTFTDSVSSGGENGTLGSASYVGAGGVSFTASSNSSTATGVIDFSGSGTLHYKTGETLPDVDFSSGTVGLSCVGTVQASSEITFDSVKISGGTFQGGSGTIKLRSETTGGFCWQHSSGTYTHQNGTVEVIHGTDSHIQENTFYNLKINHSGSTNATHWRDKSGDTCTVANDLTIQEGRLNMDTAGDTLTVSNKMIVESGGHFNHDEDASGAHNIATLQLQDGGTYDATAGVTTFTKEQAGPGGDSGTDYQLYVGSSATFNHRSGTLLFSDSGLSSASNCRNPDTMNNVKVNYTSQSLTNHHNFTCAGYYTLEEGTHSDGSNGFDVTGLVTIENGGRLNFSVSEGQTKSCGGIQIDNGGIFRGARGTTQITGKNGSNFMFKNAGTFEHNLGTMHWKADTSSGTWYAMDGDTNYHVTDFWNISTEKVRSSGTEQYRFWVGGSGRYLTVINDIDVGVNTSIFSSNGSAKMRHYGNVRQYGNLNLDSVTEVELGNVVIESGQFEWADGNSISVKSLRNKGGTVQAT